MYLILQRQPPRGKALPGHLLLRWSEVTEDGDFITHEDLICRTLEHTGQPILPLIYRVQVNYSPKHNRLLPVVCGVAKQAKIRLLRGNRPEQAHSAILVPRREMEDYITDMILCAQQDGEEVYIQINN